VSENSGSKRRNFFKICVVPAVRNFGGTCPRQLNDAGTHATNLGGVNDSWCQKPSTNLILSLTVLRVQHQLYGTHCLLLLGLLIALVLLGLDLKLTYSQKPMPLSVSVTRVVSSEISGNFRRNFSGNSGKITVLFRNNSAEKRTCQTPSYFRTMSTFWKVF